MDKYEFKLKVDEMKALVSARNYKAAAEIAETINWRKIRNLNALVLAGEIFEQVERYEESKEILLLAYDKSPIGRNIIYRLAEIAIKTKNFHEAKEYYDEFVDIAPHDNLKYVLKYKMTAAQGLPYDNQIKILEELKEQEYSEEWAYELAYLYHRNRQPDKCVEACDELILWFGDGTYVEKALELKMHYQPLTKMQEEKYRMFRQRRAGVIEVKPDDFLESGEIINETVQIPSVVTNPGRFNTANLQNEIAKGMQQIINAKKKETVSDAMDNIKKLVEDIPYLSMPKEEAPQEPARQAGRSVDDEIDRQLDKRLTMMLHEPGKKARYAQPEEGAEPEKPMSTMTIEEVLAEWEKTKQAAKSALQEADDRKLESEKEKALEEASALMDRLISIVPQLTAGMTPKELLEQEYLQGTGLERGRPDSVQDDLDKAGQLVAGINELLQKQIDSLIAEETGQQPAHIQEGSQVQQSGNYAVSDPTRELPKLSPGDQEQQRALQEKAEQERLYQERLQQQREAEEKQEQERLYQEQLRQQKALEEKQEQERLYQERLQQQREAEEKQEQERLYQEQLRQQREAEEKQEQERLYQEQLRQQRAAEENRKQETLYQDKLQQQNTLEEEPKQESEQEELYYGQLQQKNDSEGNFGQEHQWAFEEKIQEKNAPEEQTVQERLYQEQAQQKIGLEEELEQERLYQEKLQQEKALEEKLEQERLYQEKLQQERALEEKLEQEQLYQEQLQQQKALEEKLEQERLYQEQLQQQSALENASDEKTEQGSLQQQYAYGQMPQENGAEADFEVNISKERELEGLPKEKILDDDILEEEISEEDMQAAAQEAGFYDTPDASNMMHQGAPAEPEILKNQEISGQDADLFEIDKQMSEEQKQFFSWYISIDGLESQIFRLIQNVTAHLQMDKNSLSGNIIVEGVSRCGKTELVKKILKVFQNELDRPNKKIGKIHANTLNQKDIAALVQKVSGGCLIIESAGRITRETAVTMSKCMDKDRTGTLYVLEDTKENMMKALDRDSSFAMKFTEKVSIPTFSIDDYAAFGRSYANELNYDIDEMGNLALYKRISNIQRLDHFTSLDEVMEIIDEAISNAEKVTLKKMFGILTATRYNDDRYVVLHEKDFMES